MFIFVGSKRQLGYARPRPQLLSFVAMEVRLYLQSRVAFSRSDMPWLHIREGTIALDNVEAPTKVPGPVLVVKSIPFYTRYNFRFQVYFGRIFNIPLSLFFALPSRRGLQKVYDTSGILLYFYV